jgi:PIN domain of ribonuclease
MISITSDAHRYNFSTHYHPIINMSVSRPRPRAIHSLVLDTAPLLTLPYTQLKSFSAQAYYTVPLARNEIRDETSRAALDTWGEELRVRTPNTKSVREGWVCL